MINPVQNIQTTSFKANAMDKVTPEMLHSPGSYSSNPITQAIIDDIQEENHRKKNSFFKSVMKSILTIGLLAGSMVAIRKTVLKDVVVKTSEEMNNSKPMETFKNTFADIADNIEKFVTGLFKKVKNKSADVKIGIKK